MTFRTAPSVACYSDQRLGKQSREMNILDGMPLRENRDCNSDPVGMSILRPITMVQNEEKTGISESKIPIISEFSDASFPFAARRRKRIMVVKPDTEIDCTE